MSNFLFAGLNLPVALWMVHFAGDLLAQNDWMAIQKSKRLDALTLHVFIYTLTFMLYGILVGWTGEQVKLFGILTFYSHFLTDFFTSKISRRLFPWVPSGLSSKVYLDHEGIDGRSRHRFFVNLGADQLIHMITLALTYRLLVE